MRVRIALNFQREKEPLMETTPTLPRLIPVTQWSNYHTWPPIGGLRHLIFNASVNGFDAVVRRVGGRVLIDEAAFFAWANSNGGHHD